MRMLLGDDRDPEISCASIVSEAVPFIIPPKTWPASSHGTRDPHIVFIINTNSERKVALSRRRST